jgi:hypothetical protein
MAEKTASQKQLDRWQPRLSDTSKEVREEAAKVMVKVANSRGSTGATALAALSAALDSLNRSSPEEYERFFFLDAIDGLEGDVLASSVELLKGLLKVPMSDERAIPWLVRILWRLLEGGHIEASPASLDRW